MTLQSNITGVILLDFGLQKWKNVIIKVKKVEI